MSALRKESTVFYFCSILELDKLEKTQEKLISPKSRFLVIFVSSMISIFDVFVMKRNDEFKRKRNLYQEEGESKSQSEMNEKLILGAEVGRYFEDDWIPGLKFVSTDDFCFDDFVVDNFDSLDREEAIRIFFPTRDLVDVVSDLQY